MHLSGHFDPRGNEGAHEKARRPGRGDTGRRARGYSTTRSREGETIVRCLRRKNFPDPGRGEVRRNSTSKPSEKGRKSLRHSLTEHRNGPFKPILASLHRLNLRLGRCTYTFSDSFLKKFSEVRASLRMVAPCIQWKG